jgi:5-methylcytosine-specific restriction endonuclease McrA
MNAATKIVGNQVDWSGNKHWRDELPYRAVVPVKLHSAQGPMLFQVAGSSANACGAEKALRTAMKLHGGTCFYCATKLDPSKDAALWTVEHVEPLALGGTSHLGNLVIACKPCNQAKGHNPIDSFNPKAAAAWLKDLQKQIDQRLKKLG